MCQFPGINPGINSTLWPEKAEQDASPLLTLPCVCFLPVQLEIGLQIAFQSKEHHLTILPLSFLLFLPPFIHY